MTKKVKKKKASEKKKKTIIKKKEKIQKKEEIKELKDEKEESELEEITEEFEENTNENRFTEFLQPKVRAPVLERVAIAGDLTNLEQELAIFQAQQSQNTIEEEGVNYGTKPDYLSTSITNQRDRNGFQYTETPADYSIIEQEGRDQARKMLRKSSTEFDKEERNISEMERDTLHPEDKNHSEKYLSRGDYK